MPKPDVVPDNITTVTLALKRSPAGQPKGEFETTERYEARKSSYHTGKKSYLFLLDDTLYEFHYDADAASMQVTVPAQKTVGSAKEMWIVDVKRRTIGTTKYIGGNAFGVKKVITSTIYDVFGIAEDENSVIKFASTDAFSYDNQRKFEWSMDAASAKSLKPYLRLGLAGAIMDPEILEYSDGHSPTISEPYQTTYNHYNLHFSTSELLALDSRSGAVVYRWNAATSRPDDDIVVNSPAGDFVFRNLKIFAGCSEAKNSPSEVAGILINQTSKAWSNTRFLLTAHGFVGLAQDADIPLTFRRIDSGDNPFDITVGPSCRDATVAQGGSIRISPASEAGQ